VCLDPSSKTEPKAITAEERKAAFEPLCRLMKDILGDKVEKVGAASLAPATAFAHLRIGGVLLRA
jgi:HSP90 family molecular chaperone